MSNEELAIKAKDGNQDALTELWEQVRRFAEMKAGQFFRRYSAARAPNFELDDLIQSSFIALIRAIRYFESDRGTFLTMFDYCLKRAFGEVTGFYHQRDAFLYATSLDAPVGAEDDSASMAEFVPDPSSGPEEIVLHDLWISQLHEKLEEALGVLSQDQSEILRRRYYDGETQTAIAGSFGCTSSAIQAKEAAALGHLRRRSRILGLDDYIDAHTAFFRKVGLREFKNTHVSAVEKVVFKREEQRERLAKRWLKQLQQKNGEEEKHLRDAQSQTLLNGGMSVDNDTAGITELVPIDGEASSSERDKTGTGKDGLISGRPCI